MLLKETRIACFAIVGAIAAALVSIPAHAQVEPAPLEATPQTTIVPGEVIVKLRPGTSEQSRDLVLSVVDGVFVRSLDLADLILARVPVGTEIDAAESLEVDPSVIFAEPNGLTQAALPSPVPTAQLD